MSASETDSEPEPEPTADIVSSLTAFARLSHIPAGQGPRTVSCAVDTLATLDFRLIRKDTALHGLIQGCASTILALFDTVLEQGLATDNFIPDVTSILKPAFLHLLFQYRRLFRVIATRDFKPTSAPSAIVCWVDVILARLGDIITFVAAGLDGDHPDQSLPGSLKAQREEDNLRAAIQLPDNWDMLPSMLLSERTSVAAKRLAVRLLLGRYILYPALSGQVEVEDILRRLFSTFAEFVRQSAARLEGPRSGLEPGLRYLVLQERLISSMAISLFAAADIAGELTVNAERTAAFRPQTMTAAMQLLRFVLNGGEYPTQRDILSPMDRLDIPTSVIIRWGIVPQWAWNIWLEYRILHADTIMCFTTAYIRHYGESGGALLDGSGLIPANRSLRNQATMISVVIDLIFRFVSVLSMGGEPKSLSTGMANVLHRSCQLVAQSMRRNSSGIRNSEECCKALVILFGYLSRNDHYFALNDLIIECLTHTEEECTRKAWGAAAVDDKFCFLDTLGQNYMQAKMILAQDNFPMSGEVYVAQLMQFLIVMMSKGVKPLNLDLFTGFLDVVGERVLGMPLSDGGFLCETFLTCLAAGNRSWVGFSFCKFDVAVDEEAIWRLGTCSRNVNLFLASAFSLYIASSPVNAEPLTYLEGLERLVDMVLLICSRQYAREDEPLGLIVVPTICNALAHLLEHSDDNTGERYFTKERNGAERLLGMFTRANARISALGSVLRSLCSKEDSRCDEYDILLRRRLSSPARRVLWNQPAGEAKYELVFCRTEGYTRVLYVMAV